MAKKKGVKAKKNGVKGLKVTPISSPKGCEVRWSRNNSCGGFAYFLGFLGAAVYYISAATGFWNGVLGFLKALVWPAFLMYQLLKFLAT